MFGVMEVQESVDGGGALGAGGGEAGGDDERGEMRWCSCTVLVAQCWI